MQTAVTRDAAGDQCHPRQKADELLETEPPGGLRLGMDCTDSGEMARLPGIDKSEGLYQIKAAPR